MGSVILRSVSETRPRILQRRLSKDLQSRGAPQKVRGGKSRNRKPESLLAPRLPISDADACGSQPLCPFSKHPNYPRYPLKTGQIIRRGRCPQVGSCLQSRTLARGRLRPLASYLVREPSSHPGLPAIARHGDGSRRSGLEEDRDSVPRVPRSRRLAPTARKKNQKGEMSG